LTSNGTWAKADALTFLKSNMGLMSKWT
jgi:hypothetical protein